MSDSNKATTFDAVLPVVALECAFMALEKPNSFRPTTNQVHIVDGYCAGTNGSNIFRYKLDDGIPDFAITAETAEWAVKECRKAGTVKFTVDTVSFGAGHQRRDLHVVAFAPDGGTRDDAAVIYATTFDPTFRQIDNAKSAAGEKVVIPSKILPIIGKIAAKLKHVSKVGVHTVGTRGFVIEFFAKVGGRDKVIADWYSTTLHREFYPDSYLGEP